MRVSRLFLPIAALAVAACNDNLGPLQWSDLPDTVTLYSASRPALTGRASGFDFTGPRAVVLELPGGAKGKISDVKQTPSVLKTKLFADGIQKFSGQLQGVQPGRRLNL